MEGDGGPGVESDGGTFGSEKELISGVLEGSVRGNVSFVGGILGGVVAYGLGFATVLAQFFVTEGSEQRAVNTEALIAVATDDRGREVLVALAEIMSQTQETPGTALSLLGWIFYNAHGVNIGVAGEGGINVLALFADSTLIYTLIPATLLFFVGGVVALAKGADGLVGGFVSGGSVLLGYLPMVVIGALMFTVSGGGESASVQFLPAILLAGIFYPLLCGGAAGLLKVVLVNVVGGTVREQF